MIGKGPLPDRLSFKVNAEAFKDPEGRPEDPQDRSYEALMAEKQPASSVVAKSAYPNEEKGPWRAQEGPEEATKGFGGSSRMDYNTS